MEPVCFSMSSYYSSEGFFFFFLVVKDFNASLFKKVDVDIDFNMKINKSDLPDI